MRFFSSIYYILFIHSICLVKACKYKSNKTSELRLLNFKFVIILILYVILKTISVGLQCIPNESAIVLALCLFKFSRQQFLESTKLDTE